MTSFFRDPEVFDALHAQVSSAELLRHKRRGAPRSRVGRRLLAPAKRSTRSPSRCSSSSGWLRARTRSRSSARTSASSAIDEGPRRRLRRQRDARRQRRAAQALLHQGRRRLSHQQDACAICASSCATISSATRRFSKLDLVSCRNVLIYFDQALQKRVLPTLHYCLNQPGFLRARAQREHLRLHASCSRRSTRRNKIFVRTAAPSSLRFAPRVDMDRPSGRVSRADRRASLPQHSGRLAKHLDRLLLARYCPPGVLVNENLDVLLFRGQTGAYLQAAPGQPQSNLIRHGARGLIAALRATIAQGQSAAWPASTRTGVEVDQDGATRTLRRGGRSLQRAA